MWFCSGFPFWLHDIPGIVYRSDNEPFKMYMQRFTTHIVQMMLSEGLYASQGGPIILSQIENEYKTVEKAFNVTGPPYVIWAAQMALDLQTNVPWVMCKQDDAPDPVINTCNGMYCGDTFAGPNSPNKPAMWTENWTSFVEGFGEDPYIRSAEDLAFNVALFLAKKNGSYVNYYMYHGGTNFGRTGAAYIKTSYYDQAPLDEYGLIRQPKWGHLKELHSAIKLISNTMLFGAITNFSLGEGQEAFVFQGSSEGCAAFLINNDRRHNATVQYQNISYDLPPKSISILPDCKNVIFNTAKVSTQYNTRSVGSSIKLDSAARWQEFKDDIPNYGSTSIKSNILLEHMNTTKDASDFLWYTFSFEHKTADSHPVLYAESLAHVVHGFVNGMYVGTAHGNRSYPGCRLEQSITLNSGTNNISLLSVMVGLPDSGAFLERRVAGLRKVRIQGTQEFDPFAWGYQVGLLGEKLQIYTTEGSDKVQWNSIGNTSRQPLTWFKTAFDTPQGNVPVVLNLGSMGKGEAWVNGQSIGRYWSSFQSPNGYSQRQYHVPRSFLQPTGNLLVILDEFNGNPLNISVDTITISRACGYVSHSHPSHVISWEAPMQSGVQPQSHHDRPHRHYYGKRVVLECPSGTKITNILFASFGTPSGDCHKYAFGSCHSPNSIRIIEKVRYFPFVSLAFFSCLVYI
ncbi:hypothetical protein GIB67_031979 [Kingdonia uniflora]|uniref:Beta-galactosidase n=1 Tax=Kingdonia uniflora TaxID=39325 RepID=A0A7J7NTR7_9MAGN|nr:hypothetical protein GIB67_031979 [Kingdonia uniflora]